MTIKKKGQPYAADAFHPSSPPQIYISKRVCSFFQPLTLSNQKPTPITSAPISAQIIK